MTMFSKKIQLCVEVLVLLGSAPSHALVTTQALSKRLAISVSHIETTMKLLRQADLVRSVRGPGGGYCLTRDADAITIRTVINSVELAGEVQAQPDVACALTRPLEASLEQAVMDYLATRTIGEFVTPDPGWDANVTPRAERWGFGPMPERLLPQAPNSVFQLSAYLSPAIA